jgi:nucleotide-binding universal stress UspA family protein
MEDTPMYKTILAPLDGSKRAEAIVPHLIEVAHRYKAKVVFLQVIEPPPPAVGAEVASTTAEAVEKMKKQAENYLAGLKGECREQGVEARIVVGYGPIVETILNTAERENADLIALASHGRTGLSRVFYGSVAAGVLHCVDRPLLIIRSR